MVQTQHAKSKGLPRTWTSICYEVLSMAVQAPVLHSLLVYCTFRGYLPVAHLPLR